jgi:hypothetical protein
MISLSEAGFWNIQSGVMTLINELHELAKTLDSKNISVAKWHRKYRELPKYPCFRIWLNEDGKVCRIERLAPEHIVALRKYGDNQSSFPAFNISPLYRVVDTKVISELDKISTGQNKADIVKMKSWCTADNWIKGAPGQVRRSVNDCAHELVDSLLLESKNSIIAKLAELCQKSEENSTGGFRTSLEACIFEKLRKDEDVSDMLMLLFHCGTADKEHINDTGRKLCVILDVQNWRPYGYPVASEHTTAILNELLLKMGSTDEKPVKGEQSDAFGEPFVNPDEPMPNVKLAGFDVTLRSMFDGKPCQTRYNKINDGSYPISPEHRSSIKAALEWISNASNQQTTWVKIDKNEIAFVYPSKLPDVPPKFASLFGRSKAKDAVQTENRFEAVAKDFIKTFNGLPTEQKPDRIQIFSIRKIDKARSKVLFTHNSTPEQLVKAADVWSKGCRNIPRLDLEEPLTPFPLEIANILNTVWKQNGGADGKTQVESMKYYQGMELLLDILPQSAIHSFLHIQLENAAGLFGSVGYLLHSHKGIASEAEIKKLNVQKSSAARTYSVLGLLLYKCEIRKENYMEELPYLLGQWLHVSDELHVLYCKVKREGEIPPQLAGSALLTSAGEMPYQALALLSSRMNPYVSWAKQYRCQGVQDAGKESWRAQWLLSLSEKLADQITPQMNKSVRFGDFEKAQLYIGYMASLPSKSKSVKTEEEAENHDVGGKKNEQ